MRRRTIGIILGGIPALLAAAAAAPASAGANCAEDLRGLRQQASTMSDGSRRQELVLLLQKADKDEQSGRIEACFDDVARARSLLR